MKHTANMRIVCWQLFRMLRNGKPLHLRQSATATTGGRPIGNRSSWSNVHARNLSLGMCVLMAPLVLLVALPALGQSPVRPPYVVHFGDSFVNAGLHQTLRPKFKALNLRYVTSSKQSSWLTTWAHGKDLDNLYWSYRPVLFLITLGANDLEFKPAQRRSVQVKEIVRRLRGTPCVWISTPTWEGAPTEVIEVIRQNCAPCRYFDSSVVADKISRQADHRHPDAKGGAAWAEAFWKWFEDQRDPDKPFPALKPAPPGEHAPRPPQTEP